VAVPVHADEHGLEDVVSHLLRNAARHRRPGTSIRLRLEPGEAEGGGQARVVIHNDGDPVPDSLRGRIFEYGVSGAEAFEDADAAGDAARAPPQRGQGLFVARTYMAKMGGTISVRNVEGGVEFTLALLRLPER
jgi:signal transduction histidine kinase